MSVSVTVRTFAERSSPYLLGALRIVSALLFFEHGTGKLFHVPLLHQYDGVQLFSLPGAAGVIETVGGVLLTLGLFSRQAAFIMSGEMAVGYFLFHAPDSLFPMLNRGDAAVLFCFIFLYIAGAGGGAWALDNVLRRNSEAVTVHKKPT